MRHSLCLLLSLAMFCGPGAAAAQDRSTVPHDAGNVDAHLHRARAARDAGRWAEAEAAFGAALIATGAASVTEAQRAEIIGELGLCKLMLRKYRDAAEHLADSLSHRAVLNPSLKQRLDNGRLQAERYVVRLLLAVNPSDADVFVDGVLVKQHAASHELFLDPGIHTVRAKMDGHGDTLTTFGGAPGEQRTLSLQLHPAALTGAGVSTSNAAAEREDGGTADTIRIGGLALMGAAAVAGGVALGWSLAVNGDIVERRAELQRRGWPSDMCLRPSAPDECSTLREREARRDILAGVGIAGLIASGAIGLVTLTSFAVAQGDSTRESTVRVVASVGQQSSVMVHGLW